MTVVLADLEQFNGEKHINGKSIFIDKIIVQQQDTQSGTFTLLVTGNVNGQKDFEETLDFAGFALEKKEEPVNKPTDYNMTKEQVYKSLMTKIFMNQTLTHSIGKIIPMSLRFNSRTL